MEYPKFSVVTPSYNQGQFIEKTIDSVLSQGYPNLELIVIDGGSNDSTVGILKKYERHLTYWVSEPDHGQSHAINKGMAIASGDYLTWLNSDDWYQPEAIRHMHELFLRNPKAGMVIGAGVMVDSDGKEIYYKSPQQDITLESLYHWMSGGDFFQPASAFSRAAWNSAGAIDENIHIALDVDLWLRMAKSGVKFETSNTLLATALSHPQAKTTAFRDLMRFDCALVILKHGGEHVARPILDEIFSNYIECRRKHELIINNPFIKFMIPIAKKLKKIDPNGKKPTPHWMLKSK